MKYQPETDGALSMFPTRPAPSCPKCGHPYGLASAQPEYHGPSSTYPPVDDSEWLDWPCRYCGYCVRTDVVRP